MEHVIASYLRKLWDKEDCLFDGQHGFRPEWSCERHGITGVPDIADSRGYHRRADHGRIIRSRKQRTYLGKYSFVNRIIQFWNRPPAAALGTLSFKISDFRRRRSVRKVIR
jgi:hypothetical protein